MGGQVGWIGRWKFLMLPLLHLWREAQTVAADSHVSSVNVFISNCDLAPAVVTGFRPGGEVDTENSDDFGLGRGFGCCHHSNKLRWFVGTIVEQPERENSK